MHNWLNAGRVVVLGLAAACAPAGAPQTSPPSPAPDPAAMPAHPANPSDVATPEALVTALYDVISGPGEQPRDWDRFRSLFLPGARLVYAQTTAAGEERLHPLTVEDFIRIVTPVYARPDGFFERDIGHRVDRFGNVAHVFTAYETRVESAEGRVVARGINSVQLVRHEGRWWVANLAWDSERPGNPIPPEYLGPQPE